MAMDPQVLTPDLYHNISSRIHGPPVMILWPPRDLWTRSRDPDVIHLDISTEQTIQKTIYSTNGAVPNAEILSLSPPSPPSSPVSCWMPMSPALIALSNNLFFVLNYNVNTLTCMQPHMCICCSNSLNALEKYSNNLQAANETNKLCPNLKFN